MSAQQPAPYPQRPTYQPPPSNGAGLTGFIISLTGLIVCFGTLCPIGFIISLFGLKKEPRGFAVAGVVIGLVGSLVFAAAGFSVYRAYVNNSGIFGAFTGNFGPQMTTSSTMWTASNDIDAYYSQNQNTLPDQATGTALLANWYDAWNTPLQYRPIPGNTTDYEMVSAGPDQQFGTMDDYVEQIPVAGGWSSSGFGATTDFIDEGPTQAEIDYPFEQAAVKINAKYAPGAAVPDSATGTQLISDIRDAWNNPMQYNPTDNPPWFHLKSPGADGVWTTDDDILKSYYFEPTGTP